MDWFPDKHAPWKASEMKAQTPTVDFLVIPIIGIPVFIVLYFVAARFYPGGSDADFGYTGFDWMNNYWCDLIAAYSKNGQPNTGRPIALIAMITLFGSLLFFWFRLPDFFRETKFGRILIGYTGMVSMMILVFVFTGYHDEVIFIGGGLSSIPFIGTLRELYMHHWKSLFIFGSLCMVCILLNFYIYLSGWLIFLLPLIQKITLVLFLVWIFMINLKCLILLKNQKSTNQVPSPGHENNQLPD